jgi:hypothetical protein
VGRVAPQVLIGQEENFDVRHFPSRSSVAPRLNAQSNTLSAFELVQHAPP